MSNSNLVITNNEARHRYEATLEGQLAAYAEYNLLTDAIMFTHTEVLPEHEGKGVGSGSTSVWVNMMASVSRLYSA